MSSIELLGYLAAFCTTASFLPQAYKSIRHRDTKSLSLGMYVLFTLGIGLWLAYGIRRGDYAIIAANAVTLFISLAILITKIRCDVLPTTKQKKSPAGAGEDGATDQEEEVS